MPSPWPVGAEVSKRHGCSLQSCAQTLALRAGALGLTADGHVVERWFFWVGGPGSGGPQGGASELAERLRAAVAAPHPSRSDPRDALRQAISSANPCHGGAALPQYACSKAGLGFASHAAHVMM